MNHQAAQNNPKKNRIIVIGVSGSGKSTVASLLSYRLKLPFIEADDFHPPANINKMKSGIPLEDSDREPWLQALNEELIEHAESGFGLACSALKEKYRSILSQNINDIQWVYLDGTFDTIYTRMQRRSHFMKPEMLQSQFDVLETPEYGIHCSIEYSPDEIVTQILNQISE